MPTPGPSSRSDWLFQALTRAAGVGVLAVVASLAGVLVAEAWPVLSRAGQFQLFTSSAWVPTPADGGPATYGALALVWGTAATAAIAMLAAVPLGVASAAYLSEIAPGWVKKAGAFLIELLAAIPSVVYGFWGLVFLVPLLRQGFAAAGGPATGGQGVLAAGLILAVMILPYITAISFDVCQAVPRSQREGSLALGASRWQTIRNVVLPYARPGVIAAAFLALGRALGETMAVTMLIGNREVISLSPFTVGDSIASKIANQLNEADTPDLRAALVALAVVLLGVTAAFNVLARVLLARLTRVPSGRGPESGVRAETGGPVPASGGREPPGDVEPTGGLTPPARQEPTPAPVRSSARMWDRVMTAVLAGCLLLTVGPLFLILGYITVRGAGAVDRNLFEYNASRPNLTNEEFEQYRRWQQTGRDEDYPRDPFDEKVERGGLGHAMAGSLMMVAAAALMAVPPGLLAAVFLAEARRSRLAAAVRFAAELLGGVPSIVVGIFAYSCLVYPFWLGGVPWGFSGWAGAFALAVMMTPIVVRGAEEAMRLVPDSLRQASYALGATRAQTTRRVVLPAALPAVVTAVFLAVGRVAGETAPLLLTAGQSVFWPVTVDGAAPFVHPRMAAQAPFLPGYIYTYSRSPYDDWQDQAWGAAVVLLAVVMLVNVGVRLLAGKRVVAAARAD